MPALRLIPGIVIRLAPATFDSWCTRLGDTTGAAAGSPAVPLVDSVEGTGEAATDRDPLQGKAGISATITRVTPNAIPAHPSPHH